MGEILVALCLAAMELGTPAQPRERAMATCYRVGALADLAGLDAALAVALTYTESRFNPEAMSGVGAIGPMQIIPRWHCPDGRERGCDVVVAGVAALARYLARYRGVGAALCHWSQGNVCGRAGRRFARVVLGRREAVAHRGMQLDAEGGP